MEITAGKHKALALLLDPEKADLSRLPITADARPDYIFVGGSTGGDTTDFLRNLKLKIKNYELQIPVILFPGNAAQFSAEADAVLFLSLLSGNNPEYIVGQQIRSARRIRDSRVDCIPTAYILIDGGVETSTMRVTGTQPLKPSNLQTIVDTCIAAQLMGKQLIYLEAGSGALHPVPEEVIRAVRAAVSLPLIVGGGIRTPEQMNRAYQAGADIVVIGNHFESHPEQLEEFLTAKRSYSEAILQRSDLTAKRSYSVSGPTAKRSYSEAVLQRSGPTGEAGLTAERSDDERFMRLALHEAERAYHAGEVPVGCVIVSGGQIIGRGHNLTETLHDVTAHAEIQAVTAAAQTLGAKYMPDATLYVTVEPCVMCAGAIGWSQIRRVVYGCPDEKRGFSRFAPRALHAKCSVTSGVLEQECRALMQQFFKQHR
jgi:phosphoglycerol geranylgeranyltransferase